MKRLIFFLIITVFILSCQKFFKENPINKLSINSSGDLEYAIAGMNYRFASMAKYGEEFAYFFANSDA